MLGFYKSGRAVGATATTVILAIAAILLILAGLDIRLY
jgi:hypothetical protein